MKHSLSPDFLLQIAQKYGTPTYVYDLNKIEVQFNTLKQAFNNYPTQFFYACKSLTNINILKWCKTIGTRLDCVSINEIKLGLKVGFAPSDILFTPNNIAFSELEEAKQLGVLLNIDNISFLEQFGYLYKGTYPVFVRLNPHIMAGGNFKISTGHIDSKFGISIHQIRHILRIIKATGLVVHGLHMHTGSEIKDISVFLQGLDLMLDLVRQFPLVKYLDLGSGFKVKYYDEDIETNLIELGEKVTSRMHDFEKESKRSIELWFEPGKFLVSEAGYFLVRANVIKHTPSSVFVGVDSGFNHLIRPMFYDAYHLIENISNYKGAIRVYSIVGNICETDTFAWDRQLNEIREGDILVLYNAGAYGYEMASSFNSRALPAEVMVKDGIDSLIRERPQWEDLIRLQKEVL